MKPLNQRPCISTNIDAGETDVLRTKYYAGRVERFR